MSLLRSARAVTVPVLAVSLSACQTAGTGPGNLTAQSSDAARPAMERIALAARNCWFKSGNRQFRGYRLAPELNSFSGRPRILIVPADRPEDRPLAVVEGQGSPATISAYGPLMSASVGNRIATDVRRWSGGASTCSS